MNIAGETPYAPGVRARVARFARRDPVATKVTRNLKLLPRSDSFALVHICQPLARDL